MKFDYAEVKNWALITENNPYRTPELRSSYLCGDIYNDKRGKFEDGKGITTSKIMNMIFEEGIIIIRTKHTNYIINKDTVNKDYPDIYPNYWDSLLNLIERSELEGNKARMESSILL